MSGTTAAGIFVTIGEASARYAGPSVIFSFMLAGLAAGVTALCYAELAAADPSSPFGDWREAFIPESDVGLFSPTILTRPWGRPGSGTWRGSKPRACSSSVQRFPDFHSYCWATTPGSPGA